MSMTQPLNKAQAYRVKLSIGRMSSPYISKHKDTEHVSGVRISGEFIGERNIFGGRFYELVDSIDILPRWVQDRLVVLNMLPPNTAVDGVGVRLSRHTFWVFGDGKINTTGEREWLQNVMR